METQLNNQNHENKALINRPSEMTNKADYLARTKEKFYSEYLERMSKANRSVFGRLFLSKNVKELISTIEGKEKDLAARLLEERNTRIISISATNTKYVQDVCNAILVAGRSNLRGLIGDLVMENFIKLQNDLLFHSWHFAEIVEKRIEISSAQPKILQDQTSLEIDLNQQAWNLIYQKILSEMTDIFFDKV